MENKNYAVKMKEVPQGLFLLFVERGRGVTGTGGKSVPAAIGIPSSGGRDPFQRGISVAALSFPVPFPDIGEADCLVLPFAHPVMVLDPDGAFFIVFPEVEIDLHGAVLPVFIAGVSGPGDRKEPPVFYFKIGSEGIHQGIVLEGQFIIGLPGVKACQSEGAKDYRSVASVGF